MKGRQSDITPTPIGWEKLQGLIPNSKAHTSVCLSCNSGSRGQPYTVYTLYIHSWRTGLDTYRQCCSEAACHVAMPPQAEVASNKWRQSFSYICALPEIDFYSRGESIFSILSPVGAGFLHDKFMTVYLRACMDIGHTYPQITRPLGSVYSSYVNC
jgi:hypothetical protein